MLVFAWKFGFHPYFLKRNLISKIRPRLAGLLKRTKKNRAYLLIGYRNFVPLSLTRSSVDRPLNV